MQFQLVTLLSVAAFAVAQSAESTSVAVVNEESTVTSSIEDCGSTVTNCPAKSSTPAPAAPTTTAAPSNGTQNGTNGTVNPPQVTSYEGAGNALYAQAGVAAIAGVAALLL